MKKLIIENQNINGGGLAIDITGKFESNRNALAKLNAEKRTAGEVLKSLRKKGLTIFLKEIKPLMEEWHHAGVLPKKFGGGMAKAYHTKKSDKMILFELHKLDLEKEASKKLDDIKRKNKIFGYYFVWDSDHSGRYGKKINFKVARFYKGSEFHKPKNLTVISRYRYNKLKHNEGEKFYGWDEPNY